MAESAILKDQRYVGRICYGTIGEDLRARIEFVTLGISNQYAGLKASIFNRKEGVVDSVLLRFMDVWGKQRWAIRISGRVWNRTSGQTGEKRTGMCSIRQRQTTRSWQPEWRGICPYFRIWK